MCLQLKILSSPQTPGWLPPSTRCWSLFQCVLSTLRVLSCKIQNGEWGFLIEARCQRQFLKNQYPIATPVGVAFLLYSIRQSCTTIKRKPQLTMLKLRTQVLQSPLNLRTKALNYFSTTSSPFTQRARIGWASGRNIQTHYCHSQ